jgi:hypothetical protein
MKIQARPTSSLANLIAAMMFGVIAILLFASSPVAAQTEAQIPGDIRVARWDVILNDNGLDSVDSTDNSVVHTKSTVYSGAIFNADALRAAVNAATAVGGLVGGSQSMAYTQNYGNGMYNMQQLYFNYYQGQGSHLGLQGNGDGSETYEAADGGHIHIKLAYVHFNGQMLERDNNGRFNITPMDQKASIFFDGQLSPGDALAFSGTFKDNAGVAYRHMIVWEVFKSEQRYQQSFQAVQDSERWCQLGPKAIRNDVDIAVVWGTQAKHPASAVGLKWEKKLDDGKILRFTGVSRTDKWLFCWWDGDGQPIVSNYTPQLTKYYQDQPIWFSAEVSGPADEWKKQSASGHPGRNMGTQTGPFTSSICAVTESDGKAIVGVPVGDWELIGEVKKGGRIKVGNTTYMLRDVEPPSGDYMYAQFYPEGGFSNVGGDLITLSAVGKDGTELDTNYLPSITARNYGMPTPNFQGMPAKNLKTFHVWRRKQQWVTFSGIATQPATTPKDQITTAELTAAVETQNQAQQHVQLQNAQQQLASMKEKRKAWDAIPPDPKTPKGALRSMFQSAAKGDLASVRARMKATQPDSGPMLDAAARLMTGMQSARTTAIARFGEVNVDAMQNTNGVGMGMQMMDMELQMAAQPWKPRPDGGLESNGVAVIKGDNGEYYLDLTPQLNQTNGIQMKVQMQMLLGMAERMERINQLMKDNPSLTLDQLRHALTEPAPQPTTQKAATQPTG